MEIKTIRELCRSLGTEHMTLKELYDALPPAVYLRKELLKAIASECKVSLSTASKWVYDANRPDDGMKYIQLNDLTGIPVQNLFKNDE